MFDVMLVLGGNMSYWVVQFHLVISLIGFEMHGTFRDD